MNTLFVLTEPRKGSRLIFRNLDKETFDARVDRAVTQTSSETSAEAPGRVVFSV